MVKKVTFSEIFSSFDLVLRVESGPNDARSPEWFSYKVCLKNSRNEMHLIFFDILRGGFV